MPSKEACFVYDPTRLETEEKKMPRHNNEDFMDMALAEVRLVFENGELPAAR